MHVLGGSDGGGSVSGGGGVPGVEPIGSRGDGGGREGDGSGGDGGSLTGMCRHKAVKPEIRAPVPVVDEKTIGEGSVGWPSP